MRLVSTAGYDTIRPMVKSGDLLAWSSDSLIGRVIRAWTGQTYSHVGVAWVISGRVFVLEAVEGRGVLVRPLSGRAPFYWLPTGVDWTDEREAIALELVGKPYSFLDVFRSAFGLRPHGSNGWHCAEYAAHVLGYDLGDVVTPATVMDAALAQ